MRPRTVTSPCKRRVKNKKISRGMVDHAKRRYIMDKFFLELIEECESSDALEALWNKVVAYGYDSKQLKTAYDRKMTELCCLEG